MLESFYTGILYVSPFHNFSTWITCAWSCQQKKGGAQMFYQTFCSKKAQNWLIFTEDSIAHE
jgi:hypothetical protein